MMGKKPSRVCHPMSSPGLIDQGVTGEVLHCLDVVWSPRASGSPANCITLDATFRVFVCRFRYENEPEYGLCMQQETCEALHSFFFYKYCLFEVLMGM